MSASTSTQAVSFLVTSTEHHFEASNNQIKEVDTPKSGSGSYYHPGPMTILLIGSTGNGKSTLGNFLLDPADDHIIDKPTFQVATTNDPKTKRVGIGYRGKFTVVDTPGLNEGDREDLDHVIDIVKKLKELNSISACILCVKFNTKMDMQYKTTVDYYKRLLPQLFENNVLIVFTEYCTDERSVFNRKRQSIDEKAIVNNAVREVSKGLKYEPAHFQIDAVPFGEKERPHHIGVRRSILDYIKEEMKPVSIKDIKIAKTPAVRELYKKEDKTLAGEIEGFNERVKSTNTKKEEILQRLTSEKVNLSAVSQRIGEIKEKLKDLDSADLEIGKVWNLEQKWKWFETQSKEFEVTSQWPIADYSKWDNGKLSWKTWQVQERCISGEVEGRFMRGLYAKLTIKVQKRMKYEAEIKCLKRELLGKEKDSALMKQKIDTTKKINEAYIKEIETYERYIEERVEKKKKATEDLMTVEEAEEILKKFTP